MCVCSVLSRGAAHLPGNYYSRVVGMCDVIRTPHLSHVFFPAKSVDCDNNSSSICATTSPKKNVRKILFLLTVVLCACFKYNVRQCGWNGPLRGGGGGPVFAAFGTAMGEVREPCTTILKDILMMI